MNIKRANKRTKAFWRSQIKHREKWLAEEPITEAEKEYGQFSRMQERLQGHATGWINGIAWARRQFRE